MSSYPKLKFVGLQIVSILACVVATGLVGCGDSGGPDPKVESARVDKAREMRSYFDKAKGDYGQLSAEDKAQYLKLFNGDQARGESVWNQMKNGPASGSPSAASGG
jgi:hypothetical protein